MGEGLLSTGPAALLGVGRESGRKETERGRGSRLDCASLSRVENLYSTPETDITDVRGKEVGVEWADGEAEGDLSKLSKGSIY